MEYVNMVRRRAYGMNPKKAQPVDRQLSNYSDKDSFMEMLLQERGYETCFEAKRYCDLKRCGLLAEYAVKAKQDFVRIRGQGRRVVVADSDR